MKNNYLMTAVLVIVFTSVGFYGGMKYQQGKAVPFGGLYMNRQGASRANGTNNRLGLRPVAGEIISSDDKSIVVKQQDNTSRIILINNKTVINKAETVNRSELKVGEKVSVFGSENSDGSVTAQNVQLNPIQRMINGEGRSPSVTPSQ